MILLVTTIALSGRVTAQNPAPSAGSGIRVGQVDLTADSSVLGQGYIVYTTAKMKSSDGTTLEADEIRANLANNGNGIENVVLTGHVRGYFAQIDQGRSITVTTDKAVYDPQKNRIDLTGNVTVKVTSAYTIGPLIQTGDSGAIQLGKAPDYPQVIMNHVHTTLTPQQ